jgi:hypothetical protein
MPKFGAVKFHQLSKLGYELPTGPGIEVGALRSSLVLEP